MKMLQLFKYLTGSTCNVLAKKIIFFILLTSIKFSGCWVVKVVNLTDEEITVSINSSLLGCHFKDQQVEPFSIKDFDYKDVKTLCFGACTSSVKIKKPVELSAKNPLTSCSHVIATIRKDPSDGTLKLKYQDWTTDIKAVLRESTRMPKAVAKIFDQFGEFEIQELSVFRKPITPGIKQLMEAITKNELIQLSYDQLYHTGMIIKCQDQLIRLERNQTIEANVLTKKEFEDEEGFEQENINISKIKFGEFITKAMEGDPNFWKYHPVKNNCQLFVLQCLEKNKIKISDDLRKFIYQDVGTLLAKHESLKKLAIGATSLANRINNILEGTSDITVQNATLYTVRVKTKYAGESALFNSCTPDDFLLESGSSRRVGKGFCFLEGIQAAVSLKGADFVKVIPQDKLRTADIFAENSFVGQGKSNANFLIFSEGNKITIQNLGNKGLSEEELKKFIEKASANQ